jgi:enediyne biosynthesis protein E4
MHAQSPADACRAFQLAGWLTGSIVLFFAVGFANAAAPPSTAPASAGQGFHFTEITADSGIAFTNTCGRVPAQQILEVNGGGLGLVDFDNDGDLDLFIANGATLEDPEHGPGSRLYENLGGFKFKDITDQAGISLKRWATGVAAADYDGDGFDDIFVSCYGPDVLLKNDGHGKFIDVTTAAGLGDPRWGASAAFGDIDNDGDLDLYVCHYLEFDPKRPPLPAKFKEVVVMGGPHGMMAQADVLYENQGDGTFRDISVISGCAAAKPSFGLNVVIVYFDLDVKK